MALTEVTVPFAPSFNFGVGLDSTNASPAGKVVQGTVTKVTGAGAATVLFEVSRIQTTHDLERKLNVDVNASYNAGLFANVSARVDFAQSAQIHTNSLFMVITATVQLGHDSIDDPQLTPDAAALVDNPEAFRLRFGDMFVRGIDRGGLFMAVLKLETSDSHTTESIDTELKGAYGLFSGDAKTKFEQLQSDFHSELTIRILHEGGPTGLVPDTLDNPALLFEISKTWLKSFADNPDGNAVPFAVTLAPIAIAKGPLPLNAAELEHAQDVLRICANQRTATMDGMNLMNAIIQSPQRYKFTSPTSMASITAAAAGYQADLDLIAAAASAAMNHPASAKMPADFAAAVKQPFPQGIPPTPMPEIQQGQIGELAARGLAIAAGDLLVKALLDAEPEGSNRLGFEVGLAIDEGGTAQGPGKEQFKHDLGFGVSKDAYQRAVDFTVDRNAHPESFACGKAVLNANAAVAAARANLGPANNAWLGFTICAGLFGSKADGGIGSATMGTGSIAIRHSLAPSTRSGFDGGLAFFNIPILG